MQRYVVWSTLAALAASLLAAAAVWLFMRQDAPRVSRLEIPTSGSSQLALNLLSVHVAITRDGSRLVYVGGPPASGGNIFIRSLDQLGSTLLAENGTHPFVRPDGEWVGFFQTGSLRKVAVTGGPSTELLRTTGSLRGATWGPDDTIIFSTLGDDSGLLRTSGAGGNPEVLTRPDRARGEADHQWPRFLPGGQAVLFTILSDAGDSASAQVAVLDLQSPGATPRILIRGGSDARYLPTGHLVYFSGDSLRAVPFDLDRLEVGAGSPMPVLQSVATAGGSGGDFDVADSGTVVYVPAGSGGSPARTLVWVDRRGKEETIPAPPRAYLYPRLSPDGTRVALDVREEEGDIWVWDLLRRNGTRVTRDRGLDRASVWTSDGQHIVFSASREGTPNVWRQRADGTGTAEQLTKVPLVQFPLSLSPDGTLVIVSQGLGSRAVADLVTVRLDGQGLREPQPLVRTSDGETNGTISPDSRWLAYESNASRNWDVYVRPFPVTDDGARWTVSIDGGTQPRWAPNGRELFYLSPRNEMMRVPVASGSTWSSAARPEKLFDTNAYFAGGDPAPFFNYDIAKDGRFLMLKPVAGSTPATQTSSSVIVVQHWFEELKRLVPSR